MACKIIQWNARSVKANKDSLRHLMLQTTIDIFAITETWLKPNEPFAYPGYIVVRDDRDDGYGGAALLIKQGIIFSVVSTVTQHDTLQIVGIRLHIKDLYLTIVSAYKAPGVRLSKQQLTALIDSFQKPLLLLGDFNGHHTLWGCRSDDEMGKTIVDVLDLENLIVLNDGSPTRLTRPNEAPSAVDLSIASPVISTGTTWEVLPDTLGSDHLPIQIIINAKPRETVNNAISRKWNTKKANWNLYNTLLEEKLETFVETEDPGRDYEVLISLINEAAGVSIPQISHKRNTRRPTLCWWDAECDAAVKERREALRKYKTLSNETNFIALSKAQATAKKMFKYKKRLRWRKFCSTECNGTQLTRIWDVIRNIKNGLTMDTHTPPPSDELLESFLCMIAPPDVSDKADETVYDEDNSVLTRPFTLAELQIALSHGESTAPGPDYIDYPMLRHIPHRGKLLLLNIYNRVFTQHMQLDLLKTCRVVPIHKSGKSHDKPESYRPITLLPCSTKVLERLIKRRLEWWCEYNNIFPEHQIGFRKGKGTTEILLRLVTDIQLNFSRNNYMIVVFIDLTKAYDNVVLPVLGEKMVKLQFPKSFVCNIVSFLSNRKIIILQHGTPLGPRETSRGLPQGSVLAPLLFNLYTADLHDLSTDDIQILQYADDVCIYAEDSTLQSCHLKMHNALIRLHEWCIESGLEISDSKSTLMIFTRHRIQRAQTMQLGQYHFPVAKTTQYLGMIIDDKLTWGPHIRHIVSKCQKACNLIRATTGVWWGSDRRTAMTLYRSLIRTHFDYGHMCYGSASDSTLRKLDVMQYKALRIVTGAFMSTPTNAILVEANEPPLKLRRIFLCKKFLLRSYFNEYGPLDEKLRELTTYCVSGRYWMNKQLPPVAAEYMDMQALRHMVWESPLMPHYNRPYEMSTLHIDARINLTFQHQDPGNLTAMEFLSHYHDACVVYSDGSKSSDGVGCAYWVPKGKRRGLFKLHPDCTILTAELIALLEALIFAQTTTADTIVIISDSMSAVQLIKNHHNGYTNPILASIIDVAFRLQRKSRNIVMVWMKGHSGIPGNEEADALAKQASLHGTKKYDKLPVTDMIPILRKRLTSDWQEEWTITSKTKGSDYAQIHPTIPRVPWYSHTNTARSFTTVIARLKFNHWKFNKHLYRLNLSATPHCLCGDEEDPNHIFLQCPLHMDHINALTSNLWNLGYQFPTSLQTLLASDDIATYKLLYTFVISANIQV